ncbi:hypothetical protein [Bradyrhizobium sp. Ghvi]|uniref:Eco57I restriction-modification methylase domain-containing protein n=1 Tax=Bradyrhizobium sp. Ghvi TaxID=1855319 RepID=UPI0011787177|nr:hypothetical protein [Bradyrhizobium sp. Ghvi]
MQGPSDHLGQISRGVEFLSWARSTSQRFDRIVANPPYIAIERLHPEIKSAALSTALDHDVQITANGNAWYAFLCAAITLLKPNGSLCFLLPAAWDFANYAAPLRRSISAYFSAVEIYRTKDPIFRAEDVQDGSIVLIARGRRQRQANGTTSRAEVASTDELINVLASPDRGETLHLQSDATTASGEDSHQRCRLGDLIAIRLGVVTGDTSYFLLTESRRRELGLPRSSVTPVLSRARHLVTSRMTKAQWEKLRNSDERVWLFTPTAQAMKTPAVKAYLSYGRKGGCNMTNHKISTRRSWHKLSAPTNCDAFLSGMSTSLPWLSFREMAALTATNTLYTVKFVDRDLDEKRKIAIGMSMITSSARNQLRHRGRSYAAGLLKHEPCDLLEIEVPTLDYNTVSWGVYREAIAALLKGDEKTAQSIADRYIK